MLLREEDIQDLPAIMDLQDLVKILKISLRTAYRLIQDKELHAYKAGDGTWNVARVDLIAWIEKQEE